MTRSLLDFNDNLVGKVHKIKCNSGHDNKKCERCEIKYKECKCYLE